MKRCLQCSWIVAASAIIAWFMAPGRVLAQGEYVGPGQSGLGVRGGLSVFDNGSSFDMNFNYTVSGILDVGISAGRGNVDVDEVGTKFKYTGLSPNVGVFVLKQSKEIPISCFLGSSYVKAKYSADILDELNLDMTASGWIFGGSLVREIILSPETSVIPAFGLSHSNLKVKLKERFGDSISNEGTGTNFNFGLGFAFQFPSESVFFVNPTVSHGEDNTTFSVNVGFVINTTPHRDMGWSSPTVEVERKWERNQQPLTPPIAENPVTIGVSGEKIPAETLQGMQKIVQPLTSVTVEGLTSDQISLVAQVFKVPPDAIKVFRWGKSMAPAGHPQAGSTWYSLEYGDEPYKATEVIKVGVTGEIIERQKR